MTLNFDGTLPKKCLSGNGEINPAARIHHSVLTPGHARITFGISALSRCLVLLFETQMSRRRSGGTKSLLGIGSPFAVEAN
jgi:hypothetical protein